MPTTAGAAYSAQRGNEQRHIVTMALRSTASVRTGCSTGNMPRVAPFLAPAWGCNHRYLHLLLNVPLGPVMPMLATHKHTWNRQQPQICHTRHSKPASLPG